MIGDIIQSIVEVIWGQSTLEMGFLTFFLSFVGLFVAWKAWCYFIVNDGNDIDE